MDKSKIKIFLKEAILPILLAIAYIFLFHFQNFTTLPTNDKILELTLDFVNNQSLWLIFLIALIEGGLFLGQYAPGGVILFLSIVSAGDDISRIIILLTVITIAFLIAYSIDYFIGYYGVNTIVNKLGFRNFVEHSKKTVGKNLPSAIFFSYWDTNIASITSVASGALRISFKKFIFYSVIFTIFWNIFWAVLLYQFGNSILNLFGTDYLLVILGLWIIFIFYKNFIKKEDILIA